MCMTSSCMLCIVQWYVHITRYLRPTTAETEEPLGKSDHGRGDAYHVDPYRFIAVMDKVLAEGIAQDNASSRGGRSNRVGEL